MFFSGFGFGQASWLSAVELRMKSNPSSIVKEICFIVVTEPSDGYCPDGSSDFRFAPDAVSSLE